MKVALIDLVYNKGHNTLGKNIIKALSKTSTEVIVVNKGNYYDDGPLYTNVKYIKIDGKITDKSPLSNRIQYYFNGIKTAKILKNYNIDKIMVLTNDYISFTFCYKKLIKIAPVYSIIHNVNEFDNKKKYIFFKRYKDKIDFIVLDYFLVNAMQEKYNIGYNKVHVLPHPLFINEQLISNCENDKKIIVGLSSSNDDKIVNDIYKYFKDKQMDSNIKLILRSHDINYIKDNIEIYNSFLPFDKYCKIFSKAKASLILLPSNYKYRISGVAYDSLANKKKIICNNSIFARYLKEKYPNNVFIFHNIDELYEIIINNDFIIDDSEYQNLLDNNGEIAIEKACKEMFNGD